MEYRRCLNLVKMKNTTLKTFLVLLMLIYVRSSENVTCPKFCVCYLFEDFNRANCSHHGLISAFLNISPQVETLDLSVNSIAIIDNNCFMNLPILVELSLSFNAIHTIYLDAFRNLKNIKIIDLSYNRLEYFDQKIFENNKKLSVLNLNGNKLMTLKNEPIVISESLMHLYLSNAHISHVFPEVFNKVPNVVEIDISKNLLITLPIAAFTSLSKLKHLNITENRWICDRSVNGVVNFFSRKGVNVYTECEIKSEVNNKFERLVVQTTTPATTQEVFSTKATAGWKKKILPIRTEFEFNCVQSELQTVCKLYDKCLLDNKKLKGESYVYDGCHDLNEITFYAGTVVGIIIATLMIYTCWEIRRWVKNMMNAQVRRRVPLAAEIPLVESNRIAAPTVRLRRAPERSRRPRQQRNNFRVIVTSLFERRPRRYYRNATNLVRRLSQTNLFRASRMAQANENQRSRNVEETVHLIGENMASSSAVNEHEHINDNRQETTLSYLGTSNNDSDVLPRSETPPPAYADITHNTNN